MFGDKKRHERKLSEAGGETAWATIVAIKQSYASASGTPGLLSRAGRPRAGGKGSVQWTTNSLRPGGGTIGEANLDGSAPNLGFITGADNAFGLAVSVGVAQVTPATPPAFATTPQGTLSAPITLTLTDVGQQALSLTGLSFAGADPGDFLVASKAVSDPLPPAPAVS